MSIYLIKKQWGYQTCCPVDEDTIVGYFKPENPDTIKLYSEPNFESTELLKIKDQQHEQWKYNNADQCNMTLRQMDKTFGIIYNIENTGILIGKSSSIWGFEEKKDKENKITWIKIDQDEEVWAPFDSYDYSTSDEDSDEDKDEISHLVNSNNSDEEPNDEVMTLCGKTKCTDSPQNKPPLKKQKIGR